MRKVTLKNNSLSRRLMVAIIGTFIASIGIQLIVASGLGADALSTFFLGLMHFLPVRFGTLSMLFNGGVLILIYFSKKELIGLASIINSFGLGIFLNLLDSLGILSALPAGFHFLGIASGTILFGLGTGMYLLTNAGAGAYECLMVLTTQKLKLSTTAGRILLDGSFMLAGFLLGGPVGVGTILIVVLLGPVLDLTMKQLPQISGLFIF